MILCCNVIKLSCESQNIQLNTKRYTYFIHFYNLFNWIICSVFNWPHYSGYLTTLDLQRFYLNHHIKEQLKHRLLKNQVKKINRLTSQALAAWMATMTLTLRVSSSTLIMFGSSWQNLERSMSPGKTLKKYNIKRKKYFGFTICIL